MPTAYAVHFEGGAFAREERAYAAANYRQSLEERFGSAEAVIAAMQATDEFALRQWADAEADARIDAVGLYPFADEVEFRIEIIKAMA